MKKIFFILSFSLFAFFANAQNKGTAIVSKTGAAKKKNVPKTETMNLDGRPHLLLVKKHHNNVS